MEWVKSSTKAIDRFMLIGDASDSLLQQFSGMHPGDNHASLVLLYINFCNRLSTFIYFDLAECLPLQIFANLQQIIKTHSLNHQDHFTMVEAYNKALKAVRLRIRETFNSRQCSLPQKKFATQELVKFIIRFSYPETLDGIINIALTYVDCANFYEPQQHFTYHINKLLQAHSLIVDQPSPCTTEDKDKINRALSLINDNIDFAVYTLLIAESQIAQDLNNNDEPLEAISLIVNASHHYERLKSYCSTDTFIQFLASISLYINIDLEQGNTSRAKKLFTDISQRAMNYQHIAEPAPTGLQQDQIEGIITGISFQVNLALANNHIQDFDQALESGLFNEALTIATTLKHMLLECNELYYTYPHFPLENELRLARCYIALNNYESAIRTLKPIAITTLPPLCSTNLSTQLRSQAQALLIDATRLQLQTLCNHAKQLVTNNPEEAIRCYRDALTIIEQSIDFKRWFNSDKIIIYIMMIAVTDWLNPKDQQQPDSTQLMIDDACTFFCSTLLPIKQGSRATAKTLLGLITVQHRSLTHDCEKQSLNRLSVHLHIALSELKLINTARNKPLFWSLFNTYRQIKSPPKELEESYKDHLVKTRTACLVGTALFRPPSPSHKLTSTVSRVLVYS